MEASPAKIRGEVPKAQIRSTGNAAAVSVANIEVLTVPYVEEGPMALKVANWLASKGLVEATMPLVPLNVSQVILLESRSNVVACFLAIVCAS